MRIGRVWDYMMRRKGAAFWVIMTFVLAGSIMFNSLSNTINRNESIESEIINEKSPYNNSLALKIGDVPGVDGLRMEFSQNFQETRVETWPVELENEAYVRIFDSAGNLRESWYTEMRGMDVGTDSDDNGKVEDIETKKDGDDEEEEDDDEEKIEVKPVSYTFTGAPESRTLKLNIGDMIEVHAAGAKFYSTLDGGEAANYRPAATERYVVTEAGLAKMSWSVEQTSREMYLILRRFLTWQIENYQGSVREEILRNKNMDFEQKAKILQAYNHLEETDKAKYAEFIEILQKGGAPKITYSGSERFEVGEAEPNWENLVAIFDNEDGELEKDMLKVSSNVDFSQAGEYIVKYSAKDSDGNIGELEVKIEIFKQTKPEENAGIIPEPIESANPIKPVEPIELDEPKEITEPPKNNPLNSVAVENSATSVSSGPNVEDPQAPESESPQPSVPEDDSRRPVQNFANKYQPRETTEPEDSNGENLGWLVLKIGAGIVVVLGLVKFIFDHYVR